MLMQPPFFFFIYISQPSILLEKDQYHSRTRQKFFLWLTEKWECKFFLFSNLFLTINFILIYFKVMGCCDEPFLGWGYLCDFPSYAWCFWDSRYFWILCWIECMCVGYDIFLDAWYGIHFRIFFSLFFYSPLLPFFFIKKETKQRTLEELDYVFAVPTSTHVSYQVKTFLPYWIQRYIFFQNVELKPLYNFEEIISITICEKVTQVGHWYKEGRERKKRLGKGAFSFFFFFLFFFDLLFCFSSLCESFTCTFSLFEFFFWRRFWMMMILLIIFQVNDLYVFLLFFSSWLIW